MGNTHQALTQCCNTMDEQQRLIINFAITHAHQSFKGFLIQNSYALYDIILRGVELVTTIEEYDVRFMPGGRKIMPRAASNQSGATVEEVYLPYPYQLTILEHNQKPYARQQGLVLSPNNFFNGEFDNAAIHGEGTFFYLDKETHLINKTVKGRWQHNTPLELTIYNQEAIRPLLSISFLEGEQQAKLTLSDRTTYLGSIKFAEARRVDEIMTGKGVINFPNKDIYIGQIKNGIMHTEGNNVARFISRTAKTSYVGPYVKGYREGSGELTLEYEGDIFCIRCQWKRGSIVGQISIQSIRQQKVELKHGPAIRSKDNSQDKFRLKNN